MPELFTVLTPHDAFQSLEKHLMPVDRTEIIATSSALRRVLAEDITSPSSLPSFAKSAMDGYAVRAEDTFGATEALPAYLNLVGEVPMGGVSEITVRTGEAVLIHTGGALADGANAVVMVENTRNVDDSQIEVFRPVAVGENVLHIGEDIAQGKVILQKGHSIRAQDIGGLIAVGITEIVVIKQVQVAIISSGDELVHPHIEPEAGQVRDINTFALSALVLEAGGIPLRYGIIKDDYDSLREAAEKAITEADIVVISAGSSVSTRDMTAQVINSLGEPGILVHGVSIKPGKPTILAIIDRKPVFGLPGNPGSAMIIFKLFIAPAIQKLSGCSKPPLASITRAKVTRNIPSSTGREDYITVRLEEKEDELWAEPIFGKSNFISTLMEADGMAKVPLNKSGLSAGDTIDIILF
jgi:molybdopterin molybdotransferase